MKNLNLTHGTFFYEHDFLSLEYANELLKFFLQKPVNYWSQNKIKLFGKEVEIPRKERFCTLNEELSYSYSGKTLISKEWEKELSPILEKLECLGYSFNAVLINFYRDGMDSNGWHADNEKELGSDPVIASVSLGSERRFQLRSIDKSEKFNLDLGHGSLIIMGKGSQLNYKHQLPKMPKLAEPRINLTFRQIL